SVNKWIIGTPVGARSNALFISSNNTNASYAIGSYSVVIAEKLFEINSPDSLELSFDALIGGESTFDYLKVFLVDKDTMFSPSTAATYFSDNSYSEGVIMPNGTNNYINLVPATNFKVRFASPGIGVQNKLIFVWRNDGSGGTQPSCYIDNIKFLNIITPYPPTNLEANPSISTSQLTWTPGAAELGWQVRKGETGVPVYVTTPSYQANALTPSTEYTYYIRSYYADDTLYSPWVPVSFRTLAIPQRVTTLAATNINQTTSTLHATLVSGTDPITDQGFEYRVSGTTTWIPIPVILDDTINYNLIGLSAYTDYEYRAYASTDYVTIYGKSQFFKTLPAPPTTVTNPATNIEQTIVTLNGEVIIGSMPITQQGFEWRLAGANTWTTVLITSNETAITYNLTGLTPITDYEYRTFVSTTSESVYGTIQNFTTLAIVPPTIITTAATSITQTIATINASIILGSEIITDQGFEWRLSGESTWNIIPSTLVSGTITNNLTGLVASTDYEYRAYATTESGTVYGAVESFTTLAIVPPILITGDAIAVAQTIEILNGSITFGSESITDQGFEWRELGETIWMPISVALVNNNMIHNLTGLTANTDYEFRAYAITESATTYGSVIAFRTLAMDPPIVTTMPATLLSQTSATLNGSVVEVMAPILSQGFEWRELGEASWTTVSTTINNDNLAHILTGLTAYTEYEFRTYAITSEGTTYGAIQSFRTLPILPTVITNPATAITQIIATLNGSVAAGSETISLVGFEWRKQGISTWTTVELADYALVYNLSGIVASTNYEFRAFAITESGTTYGSIEIFTTLAIVPPIVVTNVSTMVGQTVATLNGTITLGSEAILSQGFEWKLASATAWTQISSTSVENVITHNLTGLTPNRQYEFRSFAVTESGTAYGSIETFTTLLVPQTVETNPATYITETNAILNSNISAGSELITVQGFEWRTASSSTWITVTTPIIGNTITYNLTGLTPYVDYEFRAYATTASGTIYGQINSFTTLAIPTIVETNTATLIGQTQATLNGTITLGSKTVSSQGFEWKLASASNW
ncbi:MAG: fibronectin type III domain-containing protein, partial [Bacteroidales bacterium]|nr:fibronectin type III domain-containing protein [Bacteroidales bacterium]